MKGNRHGAAVTRKMAVGRCSVQRWGGSGYSARRVQWKCAVGRRKARERWAWCMGGAVREGRASCVRGAGCGSGCGVYGRKLGVFMNSLRHANLKWHHPLPRPAGRPHRSPGQRNGQPMG